MKCPNDNTEMLKGRYTESVWYENPHKFNMKGVPARWFGLMGLFGDDSGPLTKIESFRSMLTKGGLRPEIVTAYKCPKCGEIKLKTEA